MRHAYFTKIITKIILIKRYTLPLEYAFVYKKSKTKGKRLQKKKLQFNVT